MIPTCGWNTKRTFDCALYAFIQLHNKNSLPPSVFPASSVAYVRVEEAATTKGPSLNLHVITPNVASLSPLYSAGLAW